MGKNLLSEIAESVGKEPEEISLIIDEFLLQLHRHIYEYKGLNGDFIGEELHYMLSRQAFFHLLGFLECFSKRYKWEPNSASEYLIRLGMRAEWLPYLHQVEAWKEFSKQPSRIDHTHAESNSMKTRLAD